MAGLPWMGWGDPSLNLATQPIWPRRWQARIAVTRRTMIDLDDDDVVEAVDDARAACERLGATIVELSAP